MLQVAYAGYLLADGYVRQYINDLAYYEPGFNLMTPLEIQGSISDRFYIAIRKRANDAGTSFATISTTTIKETATDASNGDTVPTNMYANTYSGWDDVPLGVTPIILDVTTAIDLSGSLNTRVRVVDIYIKDTTDDDFITFRVVSSDENRYFNYIIVKTTELSARNTYTALSRSVNVQVASDSDYYVLFSPYAYLKETTKDKANFSYPLNSIFYQRENTYNNEDYSFSISAYSHSFVSEVVSISNVPSYGKAAALLIDRMMYKKVIEQGENAYVDINVVGELSGISDTLRVNFST